MSQSFKKWSSFISRLTSHDQQAPSVQDRRRPSQTSCCSNSGSAYTASIVDESEHASWSDTMSTISEWSVTSTGHSKHRRQKHNHFGKAGDRFPHLTALFRRQQTNASAASLNSEEFEKAAENMDNLYGLAIDEINYAEESKGSMYYPGDRITAREAIDGCALAFSKLLDSTTDQSLRSYLQSSMAPRLLELEQKYEALPPSN